MQSVVNQVHMLDVTPQIEELEQPISRLVVRERERLRNSVRELCPCLRDLGLYERLDRSHELMKAIAVLVRQSGPVEQYAEAASESCAVRVPPLWGRPHLLGLRFAVL